MSANEVVRASVAEHTSDPMLASTFEPGHIPPDAVPRARLLDALTHGVRTTPLTLLSAAAGSGKTVLTAQWASARAVPWPVGWLTVDDACNQSAPFWRCVVEALTRAGVELRRAHPPGAGDVPARSFLMGLAADLLDLPRPVVLVLDAAEHTVNAETGAGLDFLIRHAHPRFRLVICGRADPQLPLHRYRLTDSITELRQDALAFTAAETDALFAGCCEAAVSTEVVRALTELTEGWAAGVRLAAASVQHGADPDTLADSLVRSDGSVAEYLFAEVLDAQPAHVRQFLLRTSIAEQLSPDLADHITGRSDGRRTLAALVHANAFVDHASDPVGAYRVHPLFRELLRAQLAYEAPQDVAELHRRCADWFAAQRRPAPAVEHAVAGGDWRRATALLIDSFAVASLFAQDDSPYATVLASLPADQPDQHAAVLRAAWAHRAGTDACDADRATVARLVSRGRGTTALRVSAAVVHAVVAADTAVTAAECERAVTAAAVAERLVAGVPPLELAAVVHVAKATAVAKACGAVEAVQAWSDALAASTLAGSSRLRRTSLAGLALAAALTGRLCQAVECGQAAEQLADESGLARDERPAAAPLALAWAMCERLQHAQARHWSAVAQESAPDPALCDLVLAILRARLLRSRRDTDAAVETLEPLLHAVDPPPWLQERARAELARARAAEPDAGPRFAPREMADDPAASLDVRVDAALSRACVLLEQRDVQAAVAEARQAWQLAEREQLRRPFLDSGPALRRLLRSHPALAPVAGWLGRSTSTVVALRQPAAAPSRTAQPQPVTTVDALTERETEVLRLLAELLSTEEIGAAMFVSVNTVRTHIRSILRKLAVSRRNEAVRRARELALV